MMPIPQPRRSKAEKRKLRRLKRSSRVDRDTWIVTVYDGYDPDNDLVIEVDLEMEWAEVLLYLRGKQFEMGLLK